MRLAHNVFGSLNNSGKLLRLRGSRPLRRCAAVKVSCSSTVSMADIVVQLTSCLLNCYWYHTPEPKPHVNLIPGDTCALPGAPTAKLPGTMPPTPLQDRSYLRDHRGIEQHWDLATAAGGKVKVQAWGPDYSCFCLQPVDGLSAHFSPALPHGSRAEQSRVPVGPIRALSPLGGFGAAQRAACP